MQVGEEFCGSKSEVLQESIKRQSVNYFKNYHRWDNTASADFTRYLFSLRILSFVFYLRLSAHVFVPSSHDDVYITYWQTHISGDAHVEFHFDSGSLWILKLK